MYDPTTVTAEQHRANDKSVSVSGTDTEVVAIRQGKNRRVSLAITPLTAGVTVYLALGDDLAVLNQGIALSAQQPFVQATDAGFACWQGAIHAIATGAGTVAVLEQFEEQ